MPRDIEAARKYHREYMKKYRQKPEVKIKKSLAHKRLKYGISPDEFSAMIKAQGGVCAICQTLGYQRSQNEPTLGLCIDHDHVTGKVRGLLCYRCNAALGNVDDNPALLARAIKYLKGELNDTSK